MWRIVLQGLLAGAIVVAVTAIAQRWPKPAAIILFVPLIPPLVFLAMHLQGRDLSAISSFSRQSLILLPLGLVIYAPIAFAPALRLSFWPAFAAGSIGLAVAVAIYLYLG